MLSLNDMVTVLRSPMASVVDYINHNYIPTNRTKRKIEIVSNAARIFNTEVKKTKFIDYSRKNKNYSDVVASSLGSIWVEEDGNFTAGIAVVCGTGPSLPMINMLDYGNKLVEAGKSSDTARFAILLNKNPFKNGKTTIAYLVDLIEADKWMSAHNQKWVKCRSFGDTQWEEWLKNPLIMQPLIDDKSTPLIASETQAMFEFANNIQTIS